MQIPSLCGHRGRCHGAVAENKQNSPHVFSAPSTRCPSALLTRRARRGCPLWDGMSLMGWDAPGGVRCPRHGGMPPVSCCPPVVPREIPVPRPERTPPAATSLRARHGTSQRARQAESFLLMKLRERTRAGEGLPERKKKVPRLRNKMGWDQETAGGCAGGCSEPRAPGHPHGEVWGQHRAGAQLRARAARPRLALPSCRPQQEEIFGGETTAGRGARQRARGAGGARFASPLKSLGKGFPSCLLGTCLLCLIPI